MAEANDTMAILRQNLIDAGCDAEQMDDILCCQREGDTREMIYLLRKHRKNLMEALHTSQARVDCLDYLLYQMEKQS